MFDIGFWELVLIFVLGLLVLGPERLPKVANQVGNWVGQARRMARMMTTQLREEVEREARREPDSERTGQPVAPDGPTVYSRPGLDELKAAPAPPAGDAQSGDESAGEAQGTRPQA